MRAHNLLPRSATTLVAFVAAISSAQAQPTTDRPAAILVLPEISVEGAAGEDTVLQLTNTSTSQDLGLRCQYLDTSLLCTNTFAPCTDSAQCAPGGTCEPAWAWTDFDITLTPSQTVGWRAGQGELNLAPGSGLIPPSPTDPFQGSFYCVAVDPLTLAPVERNDLQGSATIEQYIDLGLRKTLTAASYNGIGLQALAGTNNGDDDLVLNSFGGEYSSCPGVNILNHYYESSNAPWDYPNLLFTRLTLFPCSFDREQGSPPQVDVCYLTFNEFEQRTEFKHSFTGLQSSFLSQINPLAFDFSVQGTLAGQTRLRSCNNTGLLAVAIERQVSLISPSTITESAVDLFTQGIRDDPPDVIGRVATCGNGALEAGEGCDDGNAAAGDGCGPACAVEICFECFGSPSVCGPPGFCESGASNALFVRDNPTNDKRDLVEVKLLDLNVTRNDIGNPIAADEYTLCVFDGSRLAVRATVEPGGTCGLHDCWRETRGDHGYRYVNDLTNADGVILVRANEGRNGHVDVVFRAKGLNLDLPGPVDASHYFNQSPSVRAFVTKACGSMAGPCWGAEFLDNLANQPDRFRAQAP